MNDFFSKTRFSVFPIMILFLTFLLLPMDSLNASPPHSNPSKKEKRQKIKKIKKEKIKALKAFFKPDPRPPMGKGAALLLKIVLFVIVLVPLLVTIGLILLLLANVTSIGTLGLILIGVLLLVLTIAGLFFMMNWKGNRKKKG